MENAIEARLYDLGEHIDYPPVPPLAMSVAARIASGRRPSRIPDLSRWRPALAAVALFVLAATGALVASPATREAVADWLGIGGVRITFDDVPNATVGDDLILGGTVSLEEAHDLVDFRLQAPRELGEPDAVYLNRYVAGGEVSFVYAPDRGLPEAATTGVGALFSQFRGEHDAGFLKKVGRDETVVRPVVVDGVSGFWISGAPHLLVTELGDRRPAREAGNTLLWEMDGVSYRLEATIRLSRAVEIAESLSPSP